MNKPVRILILSLPKSGSSILSFRILAGLPGRKHLEFELSSFGHPNQKNRPHQDVHRRAASDPHASVVGKSLIFPSYGLKAKEILQCSIYYEKRIWLARDPRDQVISQFLYNHYYGHAPADELGLEQFAKNAELIISRLKQKESNPAATPFCSLFIDRAAELEAQEKIYRFLQGFMPQLSSRWFVMRYEDLIEHKTDSLKQYLGFSLDNTVELPESFRRLVRTKASGNWRDWFTPEDVELLRPLFRDYMRAVGYDAEDWRLNEKQVIRPEHGSAYVKRLFYDHTL